MFRGSRKRLLLASLHTGCALKLYLHIATGPAC